MPDNRKTPEPTLPLVEITREVREHLDKMGAELDKSDALFRDLQDIGLDTSRLREHVDFSRKIRDIILKHTK